MGESGCGKSTIGKTIVNLIKASSGSILYNGQCYDSYKKSRKNFYQFVQMIFQDPYGSLNPRMKIGEAFIDIMEAHKIFNSREQRIKETEILISTRKIHRCSHRPEWPQRIQYIMFVAEFLLFRKPII